MGDSSKGDHVILSPIIQRTARAVRIASRQNILMVKTASLTPPGVHQAMIDLFRNNADGSDGRDASSDPTRLNGNDDPRKKIG